MSTYSVAPRFIAIACTAIAASSGSYHLLSSIGARRSSNTAAVIPAASTHADNDRCPCAYSVVAIQFRL